VEEKEKVYLRKLTEDELVFFRTNFYLVLVEFIKSISQGLHKQINNETFNLLLDLTNEHFYDEMKEMERKEPQKLDKMQASHFVTKFCLDVL
jgi:hypothetical protein